MSYQNRTFSEWDQALQDPKVRQDLREILAQQGLKGQTALPEMLERLVPRDLKAQSASRETRGRKGFRASRVPRGSMALREIQDRRESRGSQVRRGFRAPSATRGRKATRVSKGRKGRKGR